jgi:hypothetical protein
MTDSAISPPRLGNAIPTDRALVIDVGLITLLWWLSSFIVNPIGEFPLNDDWSYSLTAKHLVETGDYRPVGWSSVTLITDVLWGALFCLPNGFSFTALRLSVLVLSWLGVLGAYVMVRDLRQPRLVALVLSLSVAFNPIYYSLSYTFMTDVPFAALSTWATVFFVRSLRSGSGTQTLVGSSLAVAATLSRQIGICIPLAFAVTLMMRSKITLKVLTQAGTPMTLCISAYLMLNCWLERTGRLPKLYYLRTDMLFRIFTAPRHLYTYCIENMCAVEVYLGLFLLPLFLVSLKDLLWSERVRALWASHRIAISVLVSLGTLIIGVGACLIITSGAFGSHTFLMPLLGNILIKSGIGPLTLRDTGVLTLDHMPVLPREFWIITTGLSLIGAALLIVKISIHVVGILSSARRCRVSDNDAVAMFLTLCGCIYLMPLLIYDFVFDRYLLLAMILLGSGILGASDRITESATGISRPLRLSACVVLVGFGAFAICGTRDYLAWNRVRWEALWYLTQDRHIDAAEIDGGFEFNGLYLYDPEYKLPFLDPNFNPELYRPEAERSWWWVRRDTYQIGFGAVPGYRVIKEYSYQHWLPPHTQKIVVLRRNGSG